MEIAKRLFIFQFWVALVAIAFVSLQNQLPDTPVQVNDKLLHFVTYTVLAISALIAYPTRIPDSLLGLAQSWPLWLCLLVFSIAMEFGQLSLPGRAFEIADMLANCLGLLSGFVIMFLFKRGHDHFLGQENDREPLSGN